MSLGQLGMVLQIAGFTLAAVFAGVLLEKGVLGVWRGKGQAWFVSIASMLESVTFTFVMRKGLIALEIPGEQKLSSLRFKKFGGMLIYAIVLAAPSVGAGCAIAGYLVNSAWLFWSGIGFLFLLPITICAVGINIRHANTQVDSKQTTLQESKTDNELKTRLSVEKRISLILLPVVLFLLLLAAILVSWLAIPFCLFLGFIWVGQLVVVLFKGKDALKKILIIVGTFVLLVGLILEFVATL